MSANRWFIVTNTENLEFFLNCGLIVDKQGFSDNAYVNDAMCHTPAGYLPCFSQNNLWDSLQSAKSEDENLTECLLELDVEQIKPSAFWRTGKLEHGLYHSLDTEGETGFDDSTLSEILLSAPLPLSGIKKIILKDAGTKKSIVAKYEHAHGSVSGKYVTNEAKLFKEPKEIKGNLALNDLTAPKPIREQIPPRELNYNKAFSYGGALSLLYYQTKNGQNSTQIFKAFLADNSDLRTLTNIKSLSDFFFKSADDFDEAAQLYDQVINCILGQGGVDQTRYGILQLLKGQEGLPAGYGSDCAGLANSLTRLVERTHTDDSDTIFEKLIKHYEDKEPGRSKIFILLTMFFVRDNSETMLKYYHSAFTEEDYCLLALFFGAISGFINTPAIIRRAYGLSNWVSFQMASYIHEQDQNDSMICSEPPPPFLIYDKCFKSVSTNVKFHDFYEWFGSSILKSDDKFVKWTMTPKDEYIHKGAMMEFRTRPKITAVVIFETLEKLIAVNTIKDAKDLFDFNPVIDEHKKKS